MSRLLACTPLLTLLACGSAIENQLGQSATELGTETTESEGLRGPTFERPDIDVQPEEEAPVEEETPVEQQPDGDVDVVDIAGGMLLSYVLDSDGVVWSLGMPASDDTVGAGLGDCGAEEHITPGPVVGLPEIVAIDAMSLGGVALDAEGGLWTWGLNNAGDVGDGSTAPRCTPAQVEGLPEIVAFSAGGEHVLALDADGVVWAWGDNSQGQLGQGDTADALLPVRVSDLPTIVEIAAGYRHSVALDEDGAVWLWGDNTYGQLGRLGGDALSPIELGEDGFVSITAGGGANYATDEDGRVRVWGANYEGELCLGTDYEAAHATPSWSAELEGLTTIVGGHDFAMGMDATGQLSTWGGNGNGQLGNGTTALATPTAQRVPLASTTIATGMWHSLAIDADGQLWAWGWNATAQLGLEDTINRTTPTLVTFFAD